jgi:hypothetical protein
MNEHYHDAAARHLNDGSLLYENQRYDNTFYLLGYVVECSLKTIVAEGGRHDAILTHDLEKLSAEYFGLVLLLSPGLRRYRHIVREEADRTRFLGWNTGLRYGSSGGTSKATAFEALQSATRIFRGIVAQMRLDGRI